MAVVSNDLTSFWRHRHKMPETRGQSLEFLDRIHNQLRNSDSSEEEFGQALAGLFMELRATKEALSDSAWRQHVVVCRKHSIMEVLHQDPFTYRAFSKPRGYAGDAVMLDYIYGREDGWPRPSMTPLGERIFNFTTLSPASAGVRSRRAFVAGLIDRLAQDNPSLRVLSIAAGHAREAEMSIAIRRQRLERFVALDADPESLETAQKDYDQFGVETVHASVRHLIANKLDLGAFDLVYSTGLFDYVGDPLGNRLMSAMFAMLRPQGRVVVANFMPEIRDIGYMETFMDWDLIYRSRQDMIGLTMGIPHSEVRSIKLYTEENQNIIFVEVNRQ